MHLKIMQTFPFATVLLLLRVTLSTSDPLTCASGLMILMQKDNHALLRQSVEMIKAYNKTCDGLDSCTYDIDEDTATYIDSATSSETTTAKLPDVPITGSITADFKDFSSHDSFADYEASCLKEGGYIHHVDTDLALRGTALDLVDLDIEMIMSNFPVCLPKDVCKGEDIERVLEEVAKIVTIERGDMSKQEIDVINGLTFDLACAATGIKKCKFVVKDSYTNAGEDISEASALNRKLFLLLVTTIGALIAIN